MGLSHDISDYPEGIVLAIDKPLRWTSADVIRKIKYAACRHFRNKKLKVGHAGTLDPLATGVLLVCIGNATKKAEELQRHDKEYVAGITFGATTPSYDLEKEIDRRFPSEHIDEEKLKSVLEGFVGEQMQVAPLFSAKSVDGVRAYEMARKAFKAGEAIPDDVLRAAPINIFSCTLERFDRTGSRPEEEPETICGHASERINLAQDDMSLPHASIRIACSKGTYIRAFARDLGEALGSGAFLNALCRSRSGDYRVDDALTIDEAMGLFKEEEAGK